MDIDDCESQTGDPGLLNQVSADGDLSDSTALGTCHVDQQASAILPIAQPAHQTLPVAQRPRPRTAVGEIVCQRAVSAPEEHTAQNGVQYAQ